MKQCSLLFFIRENYHWNCDDPATLHRGTFHCHGIFHSQAHSLHGGCRLHWVWPSDSVLCTQTHTHTFTHSQKKRNTRRPSDHAMGDRAPVTPPKRAACESAANQASSAPALPKATHRCRTRTVVAPWRLPTGTTATAPGPRATESTGGVAGVQLSHQSSRLDELNSTNFWVYGRCRFCFLRQKIMDPNSQSSKILVFFHLFINQLIAGGAPPYMNRIRLKTMAITVCYNRLDPSTGKETP